MNMVVKQAVSYTDANTQVVRRNPGKLLPGKPGQKIE
jgi:hypothetical protein